MKFSKDNFFNNNRLGFHIGPIESHHNADCKLVCPFARPWIAISIIFAIAAFFSISGYSVLEVAIINWQQADNLFSLVAALFTSFWLIGWSIGVIIPFIALMVMVFGRLVLLIHSGRVDLIIGVPGLGFRISGAASEVTRVSLVEHDSKSIFPKTGMQIEIETALDDKNTPFGSNMTALDVSQIQSAITLNKILPSNLDPHFSATQKAPVELSPPSKRLQSDESNQLESLGEPLTLASPSTMFLLAANLVPLIGVHLFDWDLGSTMMLYWAETAILLFYTVIKGLVRNKILGLISGVFTIAHAGAFMAIHLLFIWTIFVQQTINGETFGHQGSYEVFTYLLALWPALLSLFISHGYSFKINFFDKRNLHPKSNERESESFYSRITLMHITIIIGGGLAMILGDGIFALSLLIVMKIVVDVKAHLKHHAKSAV